MKECCKFSEDTKKKSERGLGNRLVAEGAAAQREHTTTHTETEGEGAMTKAGT